MSLECVQFRLTNKKVPSMDVELILGGGAKNFGLLRYAQRQARH